MLHKNWIKICIFPQYFINTPLFYRFLSSVFKKSSKHLLNKTHTLSDPRPLWLQVITSFLCLLLPSDSRPQLGWLSPRHLTIPPFRIRFTCGAMPWSVVTNRRVRLPTWLVRPPTWLPSLLGHLLLPHVYTTLSQVSPAAAASQSTFSGPPMTVPQKCDLNFL